MKTQDITHKRLTDQDGRNSTDEFKQASCYHRQKDHWDFFLETIVRKRHGKLTKTWDLKMNLGRKLRVQEPAEKNKCFL